MEATTCPVCSIMVKDWQPRPSGRDGNYYNCPNCGNFFLSGSALSSIESLDEEHRVVLSHDIWHKQGTDKQLIVSTIDLDKAQNEELPGLDRQLELLILYLGKTQKSPGKYRDVQFNTLRAKIGAIDIDNERFVIHYGVDEGLIDNNMTTRSEYGLRLTPKGLKLYHASVQGDSTTDNRAVENKKDDDNLKQPRLFISYCWSSPKHEEWVKNLATWLSTIGVSVVFDKWDLKVGHDVNKFMERIVSDPEIKKVLIISDEKYARKADNREGGVGTETQIITPEIYGKYDQNKFGLIICERDKEGNPFLPTYYKSRLYVDLSIPDKYEAEWAVLLSWIFGDSYPGKPDNKSVPSFLTENIKEKAASLNAISSKPTQVKQEPENAQSVKTTGENITGHGHDDTWLEKANEFVKRRRYKEALVAYDKAIGQNPNDARPWNGKGNAYKGIGDNDNALKAYEESISLDKNYAHPLHNKGIVLFDKGRYADARAAFVKSKKLETDPKRIEKTEAWIERVDKINSGEADDQHKIGMWGIKKSKADVIGALATISAAIILGMFGLFPRCDWPKAEIENPQNVVSEEHTDGQNALTINNLVENNRSALSEGQTGGITANTIENLTQNITINNSASIKQTVLSLKEVIFENEAKGEYYHTAFNLSIDYDVPPTNIYLAVYADGIESIKFHPARTGASISGHSGKREGYVFTNLQTPSPELYLEVVTTKPVSLTPQEFRIECEIE